jgi:hypothetical protein
VVERVPAEVGIVDVAAQVDADSPALSKHCVVAHEGALPAFGRELGFVLERVEEALQAPGASEDDLRDSQREEGRDDEERPGDEPSRRAPESGYP